MPVTHVKVNNIPDCTQAQLDAQIALGNFPPGTTLADITLSSDWNAGHTVSVDLATEVTGTLSAANVEAAFVRLDGTLALTADWDAGSFEIRAQTFKSDVTTGTAPFTVASTTVVPNLNSQRWNGEVNGVTSVISNALMYYDGTNSRWQNFNPPGPIGKSNYQLNLSSAGLSWVLTATPATPSWSTVLTAGRTSSGVNPQLTTTDRFEIRDANNYLYSSSANVVDLICSGTLNITTPTALKLASFTSNGFLKTGSGNGTVSVSANVNLASEVTGVLPVANGGGGGITTTRIPYSNGTILTSSANLTYDATNQRLVLGGASSPAAGIHLQLNSQQPAILFTGLSLDGSQDNTAGGVIALTHNGSGNRQIAFADSASGIGVRFLGAAMDAYNYLTSSRLDLQLGTDTSGVFFGNMVMSGASYAGGANTSVATRIGFGIRGFTSQSANLLNMEDVSANVLTSFGSSALLNRYNNIACAGYGISVVRASGRSTAQTAAVSSVATHTVGSADGSFIISANVLVTASATHNFTVTCAYTDEGNTARTITLNFSSLTGIIATAIANAGGAVPYTGIPVHIRAKSGTAITIATTGTFTSVTYNVEGLIKQTA